MGRIACTERAEAWPGHSFGSLVLSARAWGRVRQAGCAVLAPLVAGDSSLFARDDLLRLHIATLPLPSAFWHGSSVREADKARSTRGLESQSPGIVRAWTLATHSGCQPRARRQGPGQPATPAPFGWR